MQSRILLYLVFYLLVSQRYDGYAQKLPNVQTRSARVTNNLIKVDGRLNEREGQLDAFNKATGIFYSLANDENNLYLIVRAERRSVIKKVIVGGITFSLWNERSDQNRYSVTFPFYERNTLSWYINLPEEPGNPDSLRAVFNRSIDNRFKTIGIKGFNVVSDTIISIYNDVGIKAKSSFDSGLLYGYELAIPLKLLAPSATSRNLLHYNIKVNGIPIYGSNLQFQTGGRDFITYTATDGRLMAIGPTTPENIDSITPTYFSGKYIIL